MQMISRRWSYFLIAASLCIHLPQAHAQFKGDASQATVLSPGSTTPRTLSALNLDELSVSVASAANTVALQKTLITSPSQPVIANGTAGQIDLDLTNNVIWSRTLTSWHELGGLTTPTLPDILPLPAVPSVAGFFVGVNYSGLEIGSNVPGVAGTDYITPVQSDFNFFHAHKQDVIRLPIKWERIQPTLLGPLNAAYLGYIVQAAAYATANGAGIIVDLHNFGGVTGATGAIGQNSTINADFADLWTKLSAALSNIPGIIGYDTMNEPISSGSGLVTAQQMAINAIRSNDMHSTVFVEGDGYSGAGTWTNYPENVAFSTLTDPAGTGKLKIEAHNYLDCDNSGTHFNWVDQSTNPTLETGGTSCTASQTVTVQTGVQRATVFNGWCQQYTMSCMIGELGAGIDNPSWLTSLDNEISYLQSNSLGLTYWSAGPGFQTYPYNVQPQSPGLQPGNLTDTVQESVLEKYNGLGALTYAIVSPKYGKHGSASAAFSIYVHGYIKVATTITPSDNGAGGTFSPASVSLAAGFNGSGTFTYTPPSSETTAGAVYQISATNTAGWANPAAVGYSTLDDIIQDIYADNGSTPINILAPHAIDTAWVAPLVTLRRAIDSTTQSFAPLTSGALNYSAINTWASNSALYLLSEQDQAPVQNNSVLGPPSSNGNYGGAAVVADQPAFSTTALGSVPGTTFNNNRLDAPTNMASLPAFTIVVVAKPTDNGGRLISTEFTYNWLFTGGSNALSGDSFDTTQAQGPQASFTAPHVYVYRWQGLGTGTGLREVFVDGVQPNIVTTAAAAAASGAKTFTVASANSLAVGMTINDTTSGATVGTIASLSTTTVTVAASGGLSAAIASGDTLTFPTAVPTTLATVPANTGSTGPGTTLRMGYFTFYKTYSNGVVGDYLLFKGALSNAMVAKITALERAYYGI